MQPKRQEEKEDKYWISQAHTHNQPISRQNARIIVLNKKIK
jgi:hypothetical protein